MLGNIGLILIFCLLVVGLSVILNIASKKRKVILSDDRDDIAEKKQKKKKKWKHKFWIIFFLFIFLQIIIGELLERGIIGFG